MPSIIHTASRVRDVLPSADYFPAGCDPTFAAVRRSASAVRAGDLFVHLDPLDPEAAARAAELGAAVIVTGQLLPITGVAQVLVEDVFGAMELLNTARLEPRQRLAHIAVGGCVGGERASTLIAAVLAHSGHAIGLRTDRVEDDGEHCFAPTEANDESWWRRCELGGVSAVVTQATVARPRHREAGVLVLTSLRADRLDGDGEPHWPTVSDHRAAMRRALGVAGFNGTLVANADDPDCLRVASKHTGALLTYGESDAADVRVSLLEQELGEQTFVVTYGADSACGRLPTAGKAARRDAGAAISAAVASGLSLPAAVSGLEIASDAGSLSPVVAGQSFSVFLDEAVRPQELFDALDGASAGAGELIAVVRLAANASIACQQVEIAARSASRVFAHGDPDLQDAAPDNVTVIDDRLAAIAVALGLAECGDTVLLAGRRDESGTDDHAAATNLIRRRLACEDRRAAA